MPDASSSADRAPIERLAEEFVERYRNGEHPPLSEYTQRHPELAEQIKELFPALVLMEQFKPATVDHTGSFAPSLSGPNGAPLERVGDYRLLREIGRGGMGVVYEAEQVSLGRHVALKVLTGQARLDARHLARFEREAKAAARLHHTNIVPVYGVGSDASLHYYVMQYIAGMGLDAVLAEMRRLDPKGTHEPGTVALTVEEVARSLSADKAESSSVTLPGQTSALSNRSETGRPYWHSVAHVGVQVAEALHYAHQHGILHRDVKPSNLLLDGQGTVWVTDFGLAKANDSADLTHTGDIVGTLRYMAPERFNGQGDVRSDVYSLGLTLYELLALRPAFNSPDRNQLIREVMDAEPQRLRQLVRGLPRDLETIVHKAIARDPNDRYASSQEMAADLRRFVEDRPIQARRISSLERFGRWCRRNPVVAGLGGGVIAALVAVAVVSTVLAFHLSASANAANQAKQKLDKDKHDLELAAIEQELLADQQQQLLGQQYVSNGVRGLDAGDYGEAALWFSQALDKDGTHAERAAVHRQRLSNTLRACPRPLTVWFDNDSTTAQYSPDGRVILSFSGRMVHLRDAATGQALVAPLEHPETVYSTIFSRSGARVTTFCGLVDSAKPPGSDETFVRVWDTRTGQPLTPSLRVYSSGSGRWRFIASLRNVSAEADRVVVSADGRSFQVWDVAAGQFLGDPCIPAEPDAVLVGLILSPDGRRVLVTSGKRAGPRQPQPTMVSSLWEPGRAVPIAESWPQAFTPSSSSFISRDSRRVFVQARTGIEARDIENGSLLWSLVQNYNGPGGGLFESPDGTRLFTCLRGPGGGGPVQLLDTQTGKAIPGGEKLHSSTAMNAHYQWSDDSRFLVESGDDDLVRVFDVQTFTAVGPVIRGNNLLYQMTTVSPDGLRLLTVHGNNSVRVWDIQTGVPLTPLLTHAEPVTSAQFSHSGAQVLTASGRAVCIWPLATSPFGRLLNSAAAAVSVEAHSSDGRLLVLRTSAQRPRLEDRIEIFHCVTGERFPLTGSVFPAGRLSTRPVVLFSPDTRFILSTQWIGEEGGDIDEGGEARVLVWETTTGLRLAEVRKPGSNVTATFSPDSKRILLQRLNASSGVREFCLIDPHHADRAAPWCNLDVPALPIERGPGGFGGPGSTRNLDELCFSHDGSRLLHVRTGSVVDAATGQIVGTFGPSAAEQQAGWRVFDRLTPDRRFALWYDSAQHCQLHPTETGEPAGPVMTGIGLGSNVPRFLNPLVFNADGSRFVVSRALSGFPHSVQAWDAVAGKPLTPLLSVPSRVTGTAISPDGRMFLTAENAGTVRVWETSTGELAIPPLAHPGAISMARFSQDGKRILTVSSRVRNLSGPPGTNIMSELCVWETATGRPLTPPLPCTLDSRMQYDEDDTIFDAEGTTALRRYSNGVLELANLTADERSPEELRAFAEMLSGRRFNASGRLVPLEQERFRDDWKRLETRAWPTEARALLEPAWWHRREADAAAGKTQQGGGGLRTTQVYAVLWHLDRLLALEPADAQALQLRAEVYAQVQRWPEALADYTALIDAGGQFYLQRANVNAELGRWPAAESDFNEVLEKDPLRKTQALSGLALLRLRAGDKVGWQQACEKLRAELTSQGILNGSGLEVFTAAPDALRDWTFLDERPDPEAESRRGSGSSVLRDYVVGALLFRRGGHDEEALRRLQGSGYSYLNAATLHFFRAMILQRLGRSKEAAEALENGRAAFNAAKPADAPLRNPARNWSDRVCTELLEREATRSIEGK
jgi:serine/threonine protein kinase/WD40 repeat protein/tetratricopeptide (TPR) repeat protein